MNGVAVFAAANTAAAVAAGAASPVSTANLATAVNKPGAERRCGSFDSREQLSSDILDAPCVIC